mgnify:CR=1 FL=1
MIDFSAVRLSCGLSLPSNGTISNVAPPAIFLALAYSATYCQLRIMFWPTGAIMPDSGSIQAIFTVPDCAKAAGVISAPATAAAARVRRSARIGSLLGGYSFGHFRKPGTGFERGRSYPNSTT